MIKCPECQKDVSETAAKCPSCGFAVEKHLAKLELLKTKDQLVKVWRKISLFVGILALFVGCLAAYNSHRFSSDPDFAVMRFEKATSGGDAKYTLLSAEAAITVDQYAKEQSEQLIQNCGIFILFGAWAVFYGLKHHKKKI